MDCIFCKIINNELPSYTIYEDDQTKAIMDIFPTSNGHILVLAKQHFTQLNDLDEKTSAALLNTVSKLYPIVKAVTNCDGIHILENYGSVQEVPHVHFHIIPTFTDNPTISINKTGSEELVEEYANKLKLKLAELT